MLAKKLLQLQVFLTLSAWVSGLIIRKLVVRGRLQCQRRVPRPPPGRRRVAAAATAAGLPPPPLPLVALPHWRLTSTPATSTAAASTAACSAAVNAWWIVDLIILPKHPLVAIACFAFKVCPGRRIGGSSCGFG